MGKNAKSFELGMSDSGTQHTHTVVLLIHSFSSLKSLNVTKSKRRHD